MPDQRGCNGKPLCQPSRPPHEYRPGIRPKDATDKEARPPRSRGRSVVVLYNCVRTHRSLNKDAPVSRPVQRTGMIQFMHHPGRTSSPLRPRLSCRYTQPLRAGRKSSIVLSARIGHLENSKIGVPPSQRSPDEIQIRTVCSDDASSRPWPTPDHAPRDPMT
jgi:hypothetical protein